MKTATITEVQNSLSALLDRVRHGETILVTDRGVAVARIEPVASHPDATDRIARLERAGIIRRGLAPMPLEMLREPPPPISPEASVVEALLEERRTGR
jgi:prevent-host-death family protein